MERTGIVTMKGEPLTLLGPALKAGDPAPDFSLLDGYLNPYSLRDFSGRIKILSVTPSLDTPVCDMQARKFNTAAEEFPGTVAFINVSMDLPFAIWRFCSVAGIKGITVLSDHRAATFGNDYGVLIKELRLLARSIFIIDSSDVIRYIEIVPELTSHPDYDKVFEFLRNTMNVQPTTT